jgi:two-component system, OmpR family, sensor histidine kinase KdpD
MSRGKFDVGRLAAQLRQIDPGAIAATLAMVAGVTGLVFLLDHFFVLRHVSIIYLIPVLIAATRWGLGPALVATVAGVLCADFFFYPPYYSLDLADLQSAVELVLLVIVAIVTSDLATRLKRQVEIARRHEKETRDLYAFSRRLAVCDSAADIYSAIQEHLSKVIQARTALIGPLPGRRSEILPPDDPAIPKLVRDEAALILARNEPKAEALVTDDAERTWLVRPISARAPEFGVVAVDLGTGSLEAIDDIKARADRILVDATATLEHLDITHAISEARVRAEADLLRDALIGSVSHELRTPLTSILGAATALTQAAAIARQPDLAAVARHLKDDAERLSDIQNLFDASRITGKGIRPRRELSDPVDIVNAAVERKRDRLSAHRLEFRMAGDLPLVNVDPTLLEQALGQILDNAAKYSPAGSTIEVSASEHDDAVVIAVRDQGVGLTDEEQSRMLERYFRGSRHVSAVTGSGLGSWIAHAFISANDGTIEATSAGPDQGTTVSIRLPASRLAAPDLTDGADE